MFVNPERTIRLLRETLGNPSCRIVVSLEPIRKDECLKRIVLHNPETGGYCVMTYSGNELKLVAWHQAADMYGTEQWPLK